MVAIFSLREIDMRKILLTTTALVALGGVSAASALEISGFQRFTYHSWDDTLDNETDGGNDTTMSDENRIVLSHSVTGDSGLTASGYYRIDDMAESYRDITVSGDFGAVSLGNYTTPGGFMYNSHIYNGTFKDNNHQSFSGVGTPKWGAYAALADSLGLNTINYTLPEMGGFTVMVSHSDGGYKSESAYVADSSGTASTAAVAGGGADVNEYGIAYAGGLGEMSFRVHGIQAKADDSTGTAGDEQENQEFGINIGSGPFEARFTTASQETNGTDGVATADIEINEYSVTYKASDDLTLGIITQSRKDGLDTTNNPKLDETIFGANYFIMPGLRVQASYVDFDYEGATNNSGSQTNIALRIDY
jgi:hypothetical protein